MIVNQVSLSDLSGGAARAAFRLHESLRSHGTDSRMTVAIKLSDKASVVGPTSKMQRGINFVRPTVGQSLLRLQKSTNQTIHSLSCLPSGLHRKLNQSDAHIINLHWICGEMISIAEIGKIEKPVVWTLHDMWPFCGTEHYTGDGPDARWRVGYTRTNRGADGVTGIDFDRMVWRKKRLLWTLPIQIVAPSQWMANCVKDSALMHSWPVSVIPNALPTDHFKPMDRAFARSVLNLPSDAPLLLFGAVGGGKDPRKGWSYLKDAINELRRRIPSVRCIGLGQSEASPGEADIPVTWLGHLYDDYSLALAYNAADLTVVPSLQDNLPQLATEAQSCGCPVVAFMTGGMPDIVDQLSGCLVPKGDSRALVEALEHLLTNHKLRESLADNARLRALRLWSPHAVATQYQNLYSCLDVAG